MSEKPTSELGIEFEANFQKLFFHHAHKNECDHAWGGWREFDDGRGGEQFCSKCGLGAMSHSMRYLP